METLLQVWGTPVSCFVFRACSDACVLTGSVAFKPGKLSVTIDTVTKLQPMGAAKIVCNMTMDM